MPVTLLIVDDEDATRNLCRDVVADSGLRTRTAATTEQALEILEQYPIDIVLTDLRLSAVDTQRLQTVVDLAVRLRETIRRLSNAWENPSSSAESA